MAYSKNLNQDQFVDNRLTYEVTLRNLELFGEAATHMSDDLGEQYTDIRWRLITAALTHNFGDCISLINEAMAVYYKLRIQYNFSSAKDGIPVQLE